MADTDLELRVDEDIEKAGAEREKLLGKLKQVDESIADLLAVKRYISKINSVAQTTPRYRAEPAPQRAVVATYGSGFFEGMLMHEACGIVLRNAGRAMKTAEIQAIIRETGYGADTEQQIQHNGIYTSMKRKPAIFTAVGRGLWDLTERRKT